MIKAKDEVEEVLGQLDIPLSAAQRLTEKRTLAAPPGRVSPKDAFWLRRHLQNAPFREASYEKTHSGGSGARKMRLSVTSNPRMRFSVKCAFPHLGKRGAGSRKSALCDRHRSERRSLELRLMEKRTLLAWGAADCAFPSRRRPGGVGRNPPPACGALWKMAQLGKRARATPRQPAGGLRRGPQASTWGLTARKGAVWAEGLAKGAPRARSGYHQAASCGLRRCRELRIRVCAQQM